MVFDAEMKEALELHIRLLVQSKQSLERELLRCHEQLSLLFAVTEQVAGLQDPEEIERVLLWHYRTMLRAGALFLDRAGCCTRLEFDQPDDDHMGFVSNDVRTVLAEHIETTRLNRRAFALEGSGSLGGARVLLVAFSRADAEIGVVVALRDASEPPFDSSDVLASEAVLVHGAQILSNAAMVRHLQHSALETVCALVNAIDAKDNYTSDHSERVGALARLTGEALGLGREQVLVLEWAGMLHDIGKIGVAEQILNKPGKLTDAEFSEMKNHAVIGHEMLKPVARFDPVLLAVLHHHENHDGSGYPHGLRGDQIPLEARIIHVVDIFDALTTRRPYRTGYSLERAVRMLERDAGRVTDPHVTRAFIGALRRYVREDPDGFRARFGHLVGRDNTD